MATKTWEVKLLAGNNGIVQTTVEADEFTRYGDGVEFEKMVEGERVQVAFFPISTPVSALLSVKEVTP